MPGRLRQRTDPPHRTPCNRTRRLEIPVGTKGDIARVTGVIAVEHGLEGTQVYAVEPLTENTSAALNQIRLQPLKSLEP